MGPCPCRAREGSTYVAYSAFNAVFVTAVVVGAWSCPRPRPRPRPRLACTSGLVLPAVGVMCVGSLRVSHLSSVCSNYFMFVFILGQLREVFPGFIQLV